MQDGWGMKAIWSVDTASLYRRAYSPRHAFDVDPKRPQRYRLRLARYMVLAQDISGWAIATPLRVTRPGGILVIGVPIFFPPLHLARKHLVPRLAGILRHPATASHLQAFSLFSFLRLLRAYPGLSVAKARGFRIVS